MISEESRYDRVCEAMDRQFDAGEKVFHQFIQLSLATIGGFFWLKIQSRSPAIGPIFQIIRWILPVLAAITIVELLLFHVGWRGYRRAEAELIGRPDLRPRFPFSGRNEIFRCCVASLIGIAGFVWLR